MSLIKGEEAVDRPTFTEFARKSLLDLNGHLNQQHFLWCLGSLCRLHSIPFDATLILQQYSPPYSLKDLLAAADSLGFETAMREGASSGDEGASLPCLILQISEHSLDDTAQTENETENSSHQQIESALLVRMTAESAMVFKAGTDQPISLPIAQLQTDYNIQALHFMPRPKAPPNDEADAEPKKFGFRWFIPELLRYKKIWRDVLLASLAIQFMGLATPLFTQVVIDKVIVNHTMNTLYVVAFGLCMFMIFSAVMTWIRQYLVLHTGNRVDAVLGSKVFEHLFALPIRHFEHRSTGTLVARVQGIETIREFVSGAAVTLLLDLPFLGVYLAVMFYYSWELTLIVVAVLTAIGILSVTVVPSLRRKLNDQFQLGARNQAFLTEFVSGMETVKSLQMEPQLRRRFGDYLATYLTASFDTHKLTNTYNVTANTLEQFQVLAILGVGAWLVMTTDSFTVGLLVAFQMFAKRLSQPVLRLVGLWLQFQQAHIAVKRLGDIMDAPAEPYSITPSRASGEKGEIVCEKLSFRYSDQLPFLYRDLDLKLEPGGMVVIMGPSGSGKSTLAKLLQGFYRPSDGRILVDNRDISHLSANELRNYFGVVPQESTLYSGTLYDNLLMANPHASFEQVIQACRMAEIHDTIDQLPQGYQTEIGEQGAGLSGGQKQRVAIARALLKRPKILIFDEATSSLDHATAEHFAKTINALKGKVTMLFITHQQPKGLKPDRVVVLGEQGSLAESKNMGIEAIGRS